MITRAYSSLALPTRHGIWIRLYDDDSKSASIFLCLKRQVGSGIISSLRCAQRVPAREVMFRVHLGNTPHTLTESDFHELGQMSVGLSGSDISSIVRDALMEPIRTLQVFN